jgi:hypothetical protein
VDIVGRPDPWSSYRPDPLIVDGLGSVALVGDQADDAIVIRLRRVALFGDLVGVASC